MTKIRCIVVSPFWDPLSLCFRAINMKFFFEGSPCILIFLKGMIDHNLSACDIHEPCRTFFVQWNSIFQRQAICIPRQRGRSRRLAILETSTENSITSPHNLAVLFSQKPKQAHRTIVYAREAIKIIIVALEFFDVFRFCRILKFASQCSIQTIQSIFGK